MKNKKLYLVVLISVLSFLSFPIVRKSYFTAPINIQEQGREDLLEDEQTLPSAPLTPKNAYAIVVGISDYPGSSNDLSYCDDDAQMVYSMLIDEFNFKTENVHYLLDSAASKNAISNAFDQIASEITSDDIFFFYYSGHGGASTENDGIHSYSIDSPHDYPNNYDNTWSIFHSDAAYMRVHFDQFALEYDYDWVFLGDTDLLSGWYYEAYTGHSSGFWSGWIPLLSDNSIYIRMWTDGSVTDWGFSIDQYEVEIYNGTHFLCSYDSIPYTPQNFYIDSLLDSKLDNINCDERYIILDACNTGGMIPEVQEIGRYIMTACSDTESSLEADPLEHGVFTNYFLESFDNAADTNGDGVRSMEECYSYTYSNTVSYSGSLGYTHHPQEYDGIVGDSVLYPALGNVSLTPTLNILNYSFDLHGTGLIEELAVVVCNISTNYLVEIEDLTLTPASNTGFGSYSGAIELTGTNGFTGYGVLAKIKGNDVIYLNYSISSDIDSDSLDDVLEIFIGLNVSLADTDSDGLDDGVEYYGVTDPLDPDTDDDGLSDGAEVLIYFTDPIKQDTDGDGYSDGVEVAWGTDPLDPKNSLNTIFLNIAGIILLAVSGVYVTLNQVKSKKAKKIKLPKKKAFDFNNAETYNALKREKKFKPKPVQRPYYQKPYSSYTPQVPTNIPTDINQIRNIIQYQLPPPKNRFSSDGQKAWTIGELSFTMLNQGKFEDAVKYMIYSLILGVPEPLNSRLKNILLDTLDKVSNQNKPTTLLKTCPQCGTINKPNHKFCTNCGRLL